MFEKLIAVLERIAAALEAAAGNAAPAAPAKRGPGRPAKGEDQPAAAAATAASPAAAATPAAAAAQPASEAAPAKPETFTTPTLQKVADAIIALANDTTVVNEKSGRDRAVAILTAHGVKKVPELKAEQFQSVLDAVAKSSQPAAPSGAAGLM